jgi:hypothetical protein
MTQDDIIKMAIEARLPHYWESGDEIVYIERVEHFAKLVAQHEREACLKLADSLGWVNVDHIRARGEA